LSAKQVASVSWGCKFTAFSQKSRKKSFFSKFGGYG
jgi:hypothetical protein